MIREMPSCRPTAAAVAALTKATARLPHDAGAWYSLALARMAGRRQQAAVEAAARAWEATGSSGSAAAAGHHR
jgi:hypothetical protein